MPYSSYETPEYSSVVKARLLIVNEGAQRNLDTINARIQQHTPRFKKRINELIENCNKSVSGKIYALWEIADEMMAFNQKNVTCKRGCSHCCHIAVALSPEEADAVGKRIGRTPRKPERLRGNGGFNDFDYGYHNPCTFLKDGQCSIYANRPLACRVQYSLDAVDALLCELMPPQSIPVPYMNPMNFNLALVQIVNPKQRESVADIREFFPRIN